MDNSLEFEDVRILWKKFDLDANGLVTLAEFLKNLNETALPKK